MHREARRGRHEPAEAMAIKALAFLAADDDRLAAFLGLTGLDPGAIRAMSTTPEFGAAVMGHLLSDDNLILAFAAAENIRPEDVVRAAHVLGAGPPERDQP